MKVAEGWVAWTDFSCELPFYVPASAGDMPPPIEWVPCAGYDAPGVDCRWMDLWWDPGGGVLPYVFMEPTQDGATQVLFARYVASASASNTVLLAQADGAVQLAVLDPRSASEGTGLLPHYLHGSRAVLRALGGSATENAMQSHHEGLVLLEVGASVPRLLVDDRSESLFDWAIGDSWLIQGEAPNIRMQAFPIEGGAPVEVASPATDVDGLYPGRALFIGDTALFEAHDLARSAIMVWDPSSGTRPLLREPGGNPGYYNFGTDGTDLVWTRGEGVTSDGLGFAERSIWTSPFSTDPGALVPRRLRSDPQVSQSAKFAVGCGYAAHVISRGELLVVRLSNGHSWQLHAAGEVEWREPLALTCNELFARVEVMGTTLVYNVARVSLSSLGPGEPAD